MPSKRTGSRVRQAVIRQDQILRQELYTELFNTGEALLVDLRFAVVSWRNKPRFIAKVIVRPGLIMVSVQADRRSKAGKIFVWVDRGTGIHGPKKRPYIIKPKNKPYLKFRTNYLAKTAPVAKGATSAKVNVGPGVSIGPWVQTLKVVHPGIEARRITEAARNSLKPSFRRRVENAIRRGLYRASRQRR